MLRQQLYFFASVCLGVTTSPLAAGSIAIDSSFELIPGLGQNYVTVTGGGGGTTMRVLGQVAAQDGTYSLTNGFVRIPILTHSFSYSLNSPPAPGGSGSGATFAIPSPIVIDISDSELGDLGTIEIGGGYGIGASLQTTVDPSNGQFIFRGSHTLTETFLSHTFTSLDPYATLTPGHFQSQFGETVFDVFYGNGWVSAFNGVFDLQPSVLYDSGTVFYIDVFVTVVPEPATVTMLGIGGTTLGSCHWLRRRRQMKSQLVP